MSRRMFGTLLATALAVPPVADAFTDHLFVATSDRQAAGNCAALELQSPWTAQTNLEPLGIYPVVRHAAGKHYVVNGSPADDLRILDARTFDIVRTIPFDAGSNPQDICVLADGTAYVSFYDRATIRRIDLATGATVASLDVALYADADGLPEASRMIRDGNLLFVQLQRLDRSIEPGPQANGALAVVDMVSNQLVDADPALPGTQAIELSWWMPQAAMQIEGRRLYVCVPGGFHDQSGGIDAVDLDALRSLGLAYVEKQMGAAQLRTFVLVTPERGYFVHGTDFTQSSHLVSFSRTAGTFLAEHFVSFGLVESVVHDPIAGSVYFPDNDPNAKDIRVFDAATGAELSPAPIATGLPPVDLVLARDTVTDTPVFGRLRVRALPNPTRGAARLVWGSRARAIEHIAIVDARGRIVRSWSPSPSARIDFWDWDGRDAAGSPVAAGVYVCRIVSRDPAHAVATTKIGVLR